MVSSMAVLSLGFVGSKEYRYVVVENLHFRYFWDFHAYLLFFLLPLSGFFSRHVVSREFFNSSGICAMCFSGMSIVFFL